MSGEIHHDVIVIVSENFTQLKSNRSPYCNFINESMGYGRRYKSCMLFCRRRLMT